ncbi:hypothetical protein, partial [Enterobacter asburiae]
MFFFYKIVVFFGVKPKTETWFGFFCFFSMSVWVWGGVRAPERTATMLAKHHLRPARQPGGDGAKV